METTEKLSIRDMALALALLGAGDPTPEERERIVVLSEILRKR